MIAYLLSIIGLVLLSAILISASPRFFILCAACCVGYLAPSFLNLPTDGAWWFVELSSWSFAILSVSLLVNYGRTSIAIAVLESLAILLNLVCLWQYMTVTGWIYSIYGGVIDVIVLAEIAVLTMGAPWDGIRRMVRERWDSVDYRSPAYMRRGLDSREGQA